MIDKPVQLESVGWDNIHDVIAHHDSGESFGDLPSNDNEAVDYIGLSRYIRRRDMGDMYNAYLDDEFIGGGQVASFSMSTMIGYWIVKAKRRQGYGKLLVSSLEQRAHDMFPEKDTLELEIHASNIASRALAESMGYMCVGVGKGDLVVYCKSTKG